MAIDKKELSKLAPKDRIKKLKKLEEDRKKEVDEIEVLIRESMQDLKTDTLAEEIAPEQRPVDISRLFEASGEHALERTAIRETKESGKDSKGYQALAQTYEAYSQLQKLDKALSVYGSLTDEQKNLVGQIGERLNKAEKYISESERTASKLNAGRAVLYKLKKETGID